MTTNAAGSSTPSFFERVKSKITAVLEADYVEISDGRNTKRVPYAQFVSKLLDRVKADVSGQDILLPNHVLYMSRGLDSAFVVLYIPEHLHDVKLTGRDGSNARSYKIPFPNVVVEISLNRGAKNLTASGVHYYMTKSPRQQTAIYYRGGMRLSRGTHAGNSEGKYRTLSMPNIYGNASICMGGNSGIGSVPENDFSVLDWYVSVLMDQPFSADLSVPNVANGSHSNAGAWLSYLHGKTAFPYNATILRDQADPIPE